MERVSYTPSETRWLRLTGAGLLAIALTVIAGWVTDRPLLVRFVPNGTPMVMNAAVCVLLCGAGLMALASRHGAVTRFCGALLAIFAGIVVLQYASGRSFGADEFFWPQSFATRQDVPPGRMHPGAAVAFGFMGLALIVMTRARRWHWPLPVFGGVLLACAVMPFLNFVAAVTQPPPAAPYWGMSIATMLALLCMAAAILRGGGRAPDDESVALPFLSAALGMMISIGFATIQSNRELIDVNRAVVRSHEVRGSIDHMISEVARLESSARGYGLSGVESFRQRTEFHQNEVWNGLAVLERLLADEPAQMARVAKLRVLADQKFALNALILRARAESGVAAAAQAMTSQPAAVTSALVNLADEVQAEEAHLLEQRERERTAVERSARAVQLFGSGLALALVGLAVLQARRATAARRSAEVELRASRERLVRIFGAVADGIVLQNARGEIEECNAAAERILGLPRDQLMGRTSSDPRWQAVNEDGSPCPPEQHPAAVTLRTGEPVRGCILDVNRADGSRVWVSINTEPLHAPDGRVQAVVVSFADVTARRQAESAREQAHSLTIAALESTADGVLVVSSAGQIVTYNRQFVDIWRVPESILAARDDAAALAWVADQLAAPAEFMAKVTALYRTPEAESFDTLEFKDGRAIERYSRPQRIAERVVGRVWSFRDVTERRRAEAALREGEERLRLVFEGTPVGLRFLRTVGGKREVLRNPAHVRITGVPSGEDAIPGVYHRYSLPEDLERQLPGIEAMDRGETNHFEMEKRYVHPGGKVVWVAIAWTRWPLGRPGDYLELSSVVDITERKRLEESLERTRDQALEASRLKSEFLATMSHEIRTPMNGILGMAELLVDTPLSADQKEMGRVIYTSAGNLLGILNEILDFSKIEAGKLRFEPADFELRPLVEETLALLLPRAREKHVELRCDFDPALDVPLQGDAGRIRQVITNLVGNGLKFTDEGEVAVSVRPVPGRGPRLRFRVTVRDTGVGIPADVQPRLFEAFTQADGTATRRFGGTGLGLAISRQLTELMGGEIGFESEAGHGSLFWFELELPAGRPKVAGLGPSPAGAPPARAAAAEGPAPAPGVTPAERSLRLLLAEDNVANQAVARLLLAKMGHQVDIASNGQQALEQLALQPYDAVLMDCQMPVLNGYDATQRIRAGAVPGANPRVPVIALTAYALADDRKKCLEAGMNDYISKPVKPQELRDALERCGLLAPAGPAEPPAAGPTPAAEAAVVLDLAYLEKMRALPGRTGPSLLPELVDLFLRAEPARLDEITRAIAARETAEIARLAHAMAGSCATLGANAMRAAALTLERAARAGAWDDVVWQFAAVRAAWTRLEAELLRHHVVPRP